MRGTARTSREVVVSFQGSLSTLDLCEVLGLMAGTAKSGELHVAGNRTPGLAHVPAVQGRLWLDAGRIVRADVAGEDDLVDALVELLRVVQGTFTFRSGPALGSRAAEDVADVLGQAQARLAEWREIEQVVPSQSAWLELNPEPPAGPVALRADQWRLVVAVADGNSVEATLARLELGGLPGCRAVKEIVAAGLVKVRATRPIEVTEEVSVAGRAPRTIESGQPTRPSGSRPPHRPDGDRPGRAD
jgi:hypothetical protein